MRVPLVFSAIALSLCQEFQRTIVSPWSIQYAQQQVTSRNVVRLTGQRELKDSATRFVGSGPKSPAVRFDD